MKYLKKIIVTNASKPKANDSTRTFDLVFLLLVFEAMLIQFSRYVIE